MIVKILNASSNEFNAVQYNDKKVKNGKGELVAFENFPFFIDKNSKEEVKEYFKSVSLNDRVKNPQFHAVISTKFKEHSKEELTDIGKNFMAEMGYENQPYIIVFHNDTENNHIHLVSTRINKNSGKKINDSFEKLKSQRAIDKILEKKFGINHSSEIEHLLKYRFENANQVEMLLTQSGFKIEFDDKTPQQKKVFKDGVLYKEFNVNELEFQKREKGEKKDKRIYQIRKILEEKKESFSNKVFKVVNNREAEGLYQKNEKETQDNKEVKVSFESELQHKLKNMGLEIVFHFKDEKLPFGYSVIDHKTQKIYKGSDILKMADVFEITPENIDKRTFERMKDFSINAENKQILLRFFNKEREVIKDFMLFENYNNKSTDVFFETKRDVEDFLRNYENPFIDIFINEKGKYLVIHNQNHQIFELEKLIGEDKYQDFLNGDTFELEKENEQTKKHSTQENFERIFDNILWELSKGTSTEKDPAENELKKKRKKRRK